MKEQIILTTLNERELLRSFAINGKNTFNVRVFNAVELAKEALTRTGLTIDKTPISEIRQAAIITKIFQGVPYFKKSSFFDALHYIESISYARNLCRNDEDEKLKDVFSDGDFPEKNQAILEVFKKYKQYLKDNQLIDQFDIIHLATNKAEPIAAEFLAFEEDKLEPLSEELIQHLSKKDVEYTSIRKYINKEEKKLEIESYDNGYGSINEIENVISTIIKQKIPFDECVIALCDTNYISNLIKYSDLYKLKITYGTGYPLTFSNAGKLLQLIKDWTDNYNSYEVLNNLLKSGVFKQETFWQSITNEKLNNKKKEVLIEIAGRLRLSTDRTYNDITLKDYESVLTDEEKKDFPLVQKMAGLLSLELAEFIRIFTVTNDNVFEEKARLIIANKIEEYYKYVDYPEMEDICKIVFSGCTGKELSSPEYIHVTDLKSALSINRKHLFIVGLNAKVFPGSPTEDYLLLDSDLKRFGEKKVNDSYKKIENNRDLLFNIVSLANSCDSKIHLSYSGFDLNDLKEENPSSMFFELFKLANGDSSQIDEMKKAIGKQHAYFESDYNPVTNIGKLYLDGVDIQGVEEIDDDPSPITFEKVLSPSSIEKFYECKRKFYLSKIIGLNNDDKDNPFMELPGDELGTLVHKCMEDYAKNLNWTYEEFIQNAEKNIDIYFKKRVPIHNRNLDRIITNFKEIAKNAYEMDSQKNNEIIASEYEFGNVTHETGLVFTGKTDRIEKDGNQFAIVDFKTSRKVKNKPESLSDCLQIMIYAYMYKKVTNNNVSGGEYRYLRYKKDIPCQYNQGIEDLLAKKLQEVKKAFDSGEFEKLDKKACAKDCPYRSICLK